MPAPTKYAVDAGGGLILGRLYATQLYATRTLRYATKYTNKIRQLLKHFNFIVDILLYYYKIQQLFTMQSL